MKQTQKLQLQLESVRVRYGSGRQALTAVDGVDLSVDRGRTLGLVGESGCGKSTIARAIVGLVPIASGRLLLDGVDYTKSSSRRSRDFRLRVQMVFQDPYASLNPRMAVGEMLAEAASRVPGTSRAQRRTETLRLLDLVGLPANSVDRYPHQFSGGQRQRLALARALAVRPDVIINDEITSALDVSAQGAILNLLRDLQRELDLTYIFISHDLSTVRYMSDDVAVMYLGRVVEHTSTDELFAGALHPYARALMRSVPEIGTPHQASPLAGELPDPRNPPSGCRFRTRCPVGPVFHPDRTVCREQDPHEIAASRQHLAACFFTPDARDPQEPDRLVSSVAAPRDASRPARGGESAQM
jgi:oligopeptide/dipeptide ABC transporter ATP-binding protein